MAPMASAAALPHREVRLADVPLIDVDVIVPPRLVRFGAVSES
jgi:hypothetical protein